ncbi:MULTISPECIES: isochorismate synthase [unclassified Amycolatopsis]|uniref:isochorismate synthase n=1 Tax=Amycolatopsis sp. CFH S0078 TaxID=1644108 RepID=UPI001F0D2A76|nr:MULTISPECIES: isochorismate synthase [unclassified Amycolatopsis]
MSSPAPARPRPVHRAADLLAAYLPGSFYYSSARGVLLADGVHSHVRGTTGNRAAAAAEALEAAVLAGVANPVVVGAIGFRPDSGSSLIVPAVVRRAELPGDGGLRMGESSQVVGDPAESGGNAGECSRAAEFGGDASGRSRAAGNVAEFGGDAGGRSRAAGNVVGSGGNAGGHSQVASRAVEPGGNQSAAVAGSRSGSSVDGIDATTSWTVIPQPAPEVYAESVRRAVNLIGDGELRKVVLARALDLVGEQGVSVRKLLRNLVVADPAAHAFAVDVSAPGDPAPRTLVGASPELLVSRKGNVVTANPLAGSRRRTGDPAQDAQAISELRVSEKDLNEHALVAAQVAEVLGRYCTELDVPEEPEVIGTPTMWHLSTRITGRVGADGPSSLELAEALHPTPAVCGVPVGLARDTIARLEPEDRGYYAGLVGWTDLAGDGEWVVTIRCAEVSDKTARLFAGAGVVAGSDPAAELAETSAKFGTLLRALGAEGVA